MATDNFHSSLLAVNVITLNAITVFKLHVFGGFRFLLTMSIGSAGLCFTATHPSKQEVGTVKNAEQILD